MTMHIAKPLFAALTFTLAATSWADAFPGPAARQSVEYTDRAPVISSTAVYDEHNEPRRECWTEQVSYRQDVPSGRSYGGAIIGGVVGGLLGHQVGGGTGKAVATAVGAATGAIVGDNIDNSGNRGYSTSRPVTEEHCRTTDNWVRSVSGYNVTYRYQGHDYTTFLPYNPGSEVRVRVGVSVIDH